MSKALQPEIIVADEETGRISFGPVRVLFNNTSTPQTKTRDDGSTSETYGVSFLIPKTAAGEAVKKQLERIAGVAIVKKWPNKDDRPLKLITPVKDGESGEHTNDGRPKADKYEQYKGHWYAEASSQFRPTVVDQDIIEIKDPSKIYPGCWVNLQCHSFAYSNKGKNGASLGVDNVQFVADDDRFGGGSPDPKGAFKKLRSAPAVGGHPGPDADEGGDELDNMFG